MTNGEWRVVSGEWRSANLGWVRVKDSRIKLQSLG